MKIKSRTRKKKRDTFVPVFFVVVGIVLVGFFVYRILSSTQKNKSTARMRIVNPSQKKTNAEKEFETSEKENSSLTSFVPLSPQEILLDVISFDLNGDTIEDQVVAVQKDGNENILLIVGLYDAAKNSYTRFAEIKTNINRIRTFSFVALDMTGDHQSELIYQGVNNKGLNAMAIYTMQEKRRKFELVKIGDFESDGTIFIQQENRSTSYELSQTQGESFPVWVYSSAKDEANDVSQIQTEYEWNAREKKYEVNKTIRVNATKIAALELSRIQDGTVETFANFLNGLWYKTSNDDGQLRYLFFDYDAKEILFFVDDTEEVYSWNSNTLRRGGMYITTANSLIANMQRRCDVTLSSIDEIRLYVIDDVHLLIKETNLWNGNYRKMSGDLENENQIVTQENFDFEKFFREHPNWNLDNGLHLAFANGAYTLSNENILERGSFVVGKTAGKNIIQFRSENDDAIFAPSYEMLFNETAVVEAKGKKPVMQIDEHRLHFSPVRIAPNALYPVDGRAYLLDFTGEH